MISVISTVYNGAQYFDRAIPSILSQQYDDFEYIIVDDGSTDGTYEMLQELAKTDERIRIFNPGRLGRTKALNYAVEQAKGEYIAQQDFDDISYPHRLASQAYYLDANPDVGWVGSWYDIKNSIANQSFTRKVPLNHEAIIKHCAKAIPFAHTLVMYRKEAWQDAGRYPICDDIEDLRLVINIAAKGYKVANIGTSLGVHFIHASSYWHTFFSYDKRQQTLANVQRKAIRDLKLPKWMTIYPLGRKVYAKLGPKARKLIRRVIGGSKEKDIKVSDMPIKPIKKKTEIIITHVSNTYNYGTMMMASNLISRLVEHSDTPILFSIDALSPDHVKRLRESTGYKDIVTLPYKIKTQPKQRLLKKAHTFYRKMAELIRMKNRFVIILGGDDFSEVYGSAIFDLIYLFISQKRTQVVLMGQTIGPFYKWRKNLAGEILRKVQIYTRDSVTYEYLKKGIHLDGIITESRDIAFLPLPLQEQYEAKRAEILASHHLIEGQYITLVPSGLWRQYTDDFERYVRLWRHVITHLMEKYPDKSIALLTHVVKPDSDTAVIDAIYEELDHEARSRCYPITRTMLPVEARLILGSGYMTITGRMHAAISTYQCGKPAIALSYSPKYKGVIAEGLDLPKLVVTGNDKNTWQSVYPHRGICDAIDYVESNYTILTNRILRSVSACEEMVEKHLQRLASDLESLERGEPS